jgi:hypothetical protein
MTFAENSRLRYPDDDTKIWRYVGYPKFNWILHTRQLHFHQASEQKDPYEGGIPEAVEEKHRESDGTNFSFDEYEEVAQYSREVTFLNCWHMNEGESAAMWDLYGRSDRSIAIESTIGKLDESLEACTDYPIGAGHLRYADYESSWDELDKYSKKALNDVVFQDSMNFKDLFHLKRDSFRHEREFRAYTFFSEYFQEDVFEMDQLRDYESPFGIEKSDKYSIYTTVPDGVGFNVSVDVDKMVNKIHIAPDAPGWVTDSVKAAVSNAYDLDLSFSDVKRSTMYDDPWS